MIYLVHQNILWQLEDPEGACCLGSTLGNLIKRVFKKDAKKYTNLP